MAQSRFKSEHTTTTSSTSAIDPLDVVVTTLDGLSYANTGVMIKWKILGMYGTSNVGYFEVTTTWNLASGVLTAGTQTVIVQTGSLAGLGVTYSVVSTTTARITVTPPTASSMKWFVEAEAMAYDSSI